MKLYEIAEMYEAMESLDESIDITAALENIDGALEEKLENVAKLVRNLEAEAKAYEEEERRLRAQKQAAKNRIESIKRYVKENLEEIDRDKVKAGIFKWSLQNGPGRVEITDETKIPEEYFVTEIKPLKSEIKKAIEEGIITEGAEIVRDKSLRLR